MRQRPRFTKKPVKRRKIEAGLARSPAALASFSGDDPDPLLALCAKWLKADQEVKKYGRARKRLEKALARKIGYPCAVMEWRGDSYSPIDTYPDSERAKKRHGKFAIFLKKEIIRQQKEWDSQAKIIGLSAAEEKEEAAMTRRDDLTEEIRNMRAQSLAGIIAKLNIAAFILKMEFPNEEDYHFPFIRGALRDLHRVVKS